MYKRQRPRVAARIDVAGPRQGFGPLYAGADCGLDLRRLPADVDHRRTVGAWAGAWRQFLTPVWAKIRAYGWHQLTLVGVG